jgi:hypothetical protein
MNSKKIYEKVLDIKNYSKIQFGRCGTRQSYWDHKYHRICAGDSGTFVYYHDLGISLVM